MVVRMLQVGWRRLHRKSRNSNSGDHNNRISGLHQPSTIDEWRFILSWVLWSSVVKRCSLKEILPRSRRQVSMVVLLLLLGWTCLRRERRDCCGVDNDNSVPRLHSSSPLHEWSFIPSRMLWGSLGKWRVLQNLLRRQQRQGLMVGSLLPMG